VRIDLVVQGPALISSLIRHASLVKSHGYIMWLKIAQEGWKVAQNPCSERLEGFGHAIETKFISSYILFFPQA